MKEFIMKHPIISFLLADSAITGVVKIVAMLTGNYNKPVVAGTDNKEEISNEPVADAQ